MSITIGERTLATTRPADLNDKLIAATGCNAAEHAAILAGSPTPFQIARALAPMLTDGDVIDVPALAAVVESGDVTAIRVATLALLTDTAETA